MTGDTPKVGSCIMFMWGEVVLSAYVHEFEIHQPRPGARAYGWITGYVEIIETTDKNVFGGSPTAHNIDWRRQEWIYLDRSEWLDLA